MRIVGEQEFRTTVRDRLEREDLAHIGSVTGPGRSGAVAAVYVSHKLGVPFIPYGSPCPADLGGLLIVDTATESGKTLRKAAKRYAEHNPTVIAFYHEPPRVAFWYEARKPQRYRHELAA